MSSSVTVAGWLQQLRDVSLPPAQSNIFAPATKPFRTPVIISDSIDGFLPVLNMLSACLRLHSRLKHSRVCGCVYVRLSGSCSNFWKPWPRNFVLSVKVHLQGHLMKVKVTEAKEHVCVSCSSCLFIHSLWLQWRAHKDVDLLNRETAMCLIIRRKSNCWFYLWY